LDLNQFLFIDAEFVFDWSNKKAMFKFVVNIPDLRNTSFEFYLRYIIKALPPQAY